VGRVLEIDIRPTLTTVRGDNEAERITVDHRVHDTITVLQKKTSGSQDAVYTVFFKKRPIIIVK